ncbi:MAG: dihydrolipoyl dehydrogenase family protein [Kineosporiaceae bacterium]
MTDESSVHTVVVGAGSGGLTVAVGVAARGHRVALVEERDVGGDCTNVGCVPSKTLIHQARLLGPGGGRAALAHVRARRDSLRDRETREFGQLPGVDLIRGRARLLPGRRVLVTAADGTGTTLTARHVVVATGARPRTVEVPGLPAHRSLTNETVFDLEDAPAHLAVLGGGVIAMELAFAFRRLGSRVSVVTPRDRVLERFPPEVAEVLAGSLRDRGIDVHLGCVADSYDEGSQALTLRPVRATGPGTVLSGVDRVLQAVGRRRATDGLGLAEAGVRVDAAGAVVTDGWGRTTARGVWAVGDVTATAAHTHAANAQGRRVAQRIGLPWLPALGREPSYPTATFAEPEVATAGLGPDEIARRYHPGAVTTLRVDLARETDRGYTDDLVAGFIRVDALRLTGRILGAVVVGPRASETVTQLSVAIAGGVSLHRLFRVVQPYPTYASGIQRVADAFLAGTLPHLPRELAAYLRHRWARPPR